MSVHVNHDYHLVEPSPWPIVGTIAAIGLAVGLLLFMHDFTPWLLIIGIALTLYTMFVWWRDIVKEATFNGDHKPVVQIGLRFGMALFIASEVMFFVAWFWAYFNAGLFPSAEIGSVWPPEGVQVFSPWELPLLNTVILLTSSTTVTWAHHALRKGDYKNLKLGLWVTVLLGLAFTGIQAAEYAEAHFGFGGDIYGSTFFMATGFHGAHVIIGTIFLGICLIRAYKGHLKPDHHFGLEAAAWYWHFVDVVWIFLFCSIYWWGSA
jgi:cytochrome c oxidase subunit 3